MDLRKLQKQLQEDFARTCPDYFHHATTIEVKIDERGVDVKIWGWSYKTEEITGAPEGSHAVFSDRKNSLKKAVASFYEKLKSVDNKIELEEE